MNEAVRLARQAMATRFEIALHGDDPVALRAAGEEALDEIERWEARLSLYRPDSEIAHVNARAAREPVRVTPDVWRLLEQARRLSEETEGAFDLTIAPLVRIWGFMGGTGALPEPALVEKARQCVGMKRVELNAEDFTIRFERDGMMLDLGAIGKGFALERAAALLRENGVTSALLHAGTSSVCAIGVPPEAAAWKIGLELPSEVTGGDALPLAVIELKDESLSVSGIWGRSFKAAGRTFGHVLDPRTGRPVENALMACVVCASTTETDALSTALLVLGEGGRMNRIRSQRPGSKIFTLVRRGGMLLGGGHGIDFFHSALAKVGEMTIRGGSPPPI
jgi:thiamine biosynthesis lipoprotein